MEFSNDQNIHFSCQIQVKTDSSQVDLYVEGPELCRNKMKMNLDWNGNLKFDFYQQFCVSLAYTDK